MAWSIGDVSHPGSALEFDQFRADDQEGHMSAPMMGWSAMSDEARVIVPRDWGAASADRIDAYCWPTGSRGALSATMRFEKFPIKPGEITALLR